VGFRHLFDNLPSLIPPHLSFTVTPSLPPRLARFTCDTCVVSTSRRAGGDEEDDDDHDLPTSHTVKQRWWLLSWTTNPSTVIVTVIVIAIVARWIRPGGCRVGRRLGKLLGLPERVRIRATMDYGLGQMPYGRIVCGALAVYPAPRWLLALDRR